MSGWEPDDIGSDSPTLMTGSACGSTTNWWNWVPDHPTGKMPPISPGPPGIDDLVPGGIAASGIQMAVTHLQFFRDIYYRSEHVEDPYEADPTGMNESSNERGIDRFPGRPARVAGTLQQYCPRGGVPAGARRVPDARRQFRQEQGRTTVGKPPRSRQATRGAAVGAGRQSLLHLLAARCAVSPTMVEVSPTARTRY
ncbi:MAG: hypothetical protein Ct9H300mP1_18240 [Planctomycetaceae bacterium]|nr:MAG: hypothetical protein Ct9H300mP1_18240 [Planctomycetaceae bacterium]